MTPPRNREDGSRHPLRAALRDYAGVGFIILFAVWMLAS